MPNNLSGHRKMDWARPHMKVLNALREEYLPAQPFKGIRLSMCIHLEAKTACLCEVLRDLGADLAITSSNPLSTQPDVAEALQERGIAVYAEKTLDEDTYWKNMDAVLAIDPHILIDDGADLGIRLMEQKQEKFSKLLGICEETTTGLQRYRALDREGLMPIPVIAVNDSRMKYLFDNRYGTGQSTWDGIIRSTNVSISGKTVVVAGYGWCGKGIALRAKAYGAKVIITEIDPVKACEAEMDGFSSMTMTQAAPLGDIFVTATGNIDVITKTHFPLMKDGAILANAGHFDVEVKVADLKTISVSSREMKPGIEGFKLENGKELFLLAYGRLVNLVNGDGHPIEIMDLSFSIQLEAARYLLQEKGKLSGGVSSVPSSIDEKIARLKLYSDQVSVDELNETQHSYLNSWKL